MRHVGHLLAHAIASRHALPWHMVKALEQIHNTASTASAEVVSGEDLCQVVPLQQERAGKVSFADVAFACEGEHPLRTGHGQILKTFNSDSEANIEANQEPNPSVDRQWAACAIPSMRQMFRDEGTLHFLFGSLCV